MTPVSSNATRKEKQETPWAVFSKEDRDNIDPQINSDDDRITDDAQAGLPTSRLALTPPSGALHSPGFIAAAAYVRVNTN